MTTSRRPGAPQGGLAPPATARLPDGTRLELRPLARQISDAHFARHPDELERYGEAGREWCTHDNQHLLSWAALDLGGLIDFDQQLRWLANVLASRGYPVERLADNLRTAQALIDRLADRDAQRGLARRLGSAAGTLTA